jgi:SAM-dependent methyltransferase
MSRARRLPSLSLSAWLRFDVVERLLPDHAGSLLEIGAGTGSMGTLLARRFEYVGLEPDRSSYEIAVRRVGSAGVVLNTTAEDFSRSDPFDVICAFEVLEHLEDDRAAVEGWLRHLRPGGCLLVSVPHGRTRFGAWDERAGHFRRYDHDDLAGVLRSAGAEAVTTVAYGFPLGSATAFARSVVARLDRHQESTMEERTAGSARNLQPPEWAAVATRAVALPFQFAQRPFGSKHVGPGIVGRGFLPS